MRPTTKGAMIAPQACVEKARPLCSPVACRLYLRKVPRVTNHPPHVKNSMNSITLKRIFMVFFSTGVASVEKREPGTPQRTPGCRPQSHGAQVIAMQFRCQKHWNICSAARGGRISRRLRDFPPDTARRVTREHGFDEQVAAITIGERGESGRPRSRFRPLPDPSIRVRNYIAESVGPGFLMPGRQVRVGCRLWGEDGRVLADHDARLAESADPQLVLALLQPAHRGLASTDFELQVVLVAWKHLADGDAALGATAKPQQHGRQVLAPDAHAAPPPGS